MIKKSFLVDLTAEVYFFHFFKHVSMLISYFNRRHIFKCSSSFTFKRGGAFSACCIFTRSYPSFSIGSTQKRDKKMSTIVQLLLTLTNHNISHSDEVRIQLITITITDNFWQEPNTFKGRHIYKNERPVYHADCKDEYRPLLCRPHSR